MILGAGIAVLTFLLGCVLGDRSGFTRGKLEATRMETVRVEGLLKNWGKR